MLHQHLYLGYMYMIKTINKVVAFLKQRVIMFSPESLHINRTEKQFSPVASLPPEHPVLGVPKNKK